MQAPHAHPIGRLPELSAVPGVKLFLACGFLAKRSNVEGRLVPITIQHKFVILGGVEKVSIFPETVWTLGVGHLYDCK